MLDSCSSYCVYDKYTSQFSLPKYAGNLILYEFMYNQNVNWVCVIA